MKVKKIIGVVFSLVGIGLFIGSIFFFINTQQFLSTARSSVGTVIDLVRVESSDSDGTSITYKPIIEYKAPNGELYQFGSQSSSNPPAYDIGERVDVLYNPEDFYDARIDSFFDLWFAALMMSGMGLIFGGVGIGFVISIIRWYKKKAWLDQNGLRVEAGIVGVYKNRSVSSNGKHPWYIKVTLRNPHTGEDLEIKSLNFWKDPQRIIDKLGLRTLPVIVDPSDYTKNYLQTDFIKEEMKKH